VLNERERRILSAIEQGLDQDDPDLRGRLAPARRWMPSWRAVAAGLGLVVAVCLVLLGLVGHALLFLAVACGPWLLHRFLRRPGTGHTPTPAPAPETGE
jgi:Flp pilus assembly protein TadB